MKKFFSLVIVCVLIAGSIFENLANRSVAIPGPLKKIYLAGFKHTF